MVSQWKVDSASTAELMIEFHRNLVSKIPPQQPSWKKADSLRRAMLTLMKNPKYKDPYSRILLGELYYGARKSARVTENL